MGGGGQGNGWKGAGVGGGWGWGVEEVEGVEGGKLHNAGSSLNVHFCLTTSVIFITFLAVLL